MKPCSCVDLVNQKLAEQNNRLVLGFNLMGPPRPSVYVVVATEEIEHVRGKKPIVLFASFCPFCGCKWEMGPEPAQSGEEVPK